jgi:hypothetical protein
MARNPHALPSRSKADEATSASNVLGRTVRLGALCDDFEDADWHYDYQRHTCYRRFWRTDHRGEPKLLKRVTTPDDGKQGSTGALEIRTQALDIRTNKYYSDEEIKAFRRPRPAGPDFSILTQDDLLTAEFAKKLGRKLTRADQPVFILRIWLPPFEQWIKGCNNLGFRHAPRSNKSGEYYPSIWLHDSPDTGPRFVFRIGTGVALDGVGEPIKQPGWWTLALAFDEEGIGHYYARPGVDLPTGKDRMFDTTRFRTANGTDNPTMDHVGYGFFSLAVPNDGKTSPRFVIDDYEVWVVKR